MTASLPPVGQVNVADSAPLRTSSIPPLGPGRPSMPTTRIPVIPSFIAARCAPSAIASFWAKMTSTLPVLREPRGQLVLGLVPQPVGDDRADDGDVVPLRNCFPEAEAPVQDGGRAGPAHDLDDLSALRAQQLGDVLPRLLADEPVVGADEKRVVEPDDRPVQEDDGNAVVGFRDDRCESLGIVGGEDEKVDAGAQQGVDVLDLAAVRVRGIREDHAKILPCPPPPP